MPDTYTLPDLAYDYGALEPHVSGRIIELHHDKHHAAYVTGANTTLDKLASARDAGDFGAITALEKNLAFHVSGHVLHSIFWTNLSPNGGGEPTGDLAEQIGTDFGGFEGFKKQLNEAAATVQGSGWGVVSWEPVAARLVVQQVYDHQSNFAQGSLPILVIDAWEHAWYLQYENRKAEFFAALWNIISWDDVARRLTAAKGAAVPVS